MQVDMHYYGTYAMARAAGLAPDDCRVIATAAQFVDDNAGKDSISFKDGARVDVDATAHHALDVANLDPEDQRNVWIPFHFIPGNARAEYTERLICRRDSGDGHPSPRFERQEVLPAARGDYGTCLRGHLLALRLQRRVLAEEPDRHGFTEGRERGAPQRGSERSPPRAG